MTQVRKLTADRPVELAPGAMMFPLFGEAAMLNVVDLEPGTEIPVHSHPHEQLGIVLAGEVTMVFGGEERRLGPDDAYQVPGGVEHGGRAGPEGCRVLDVFVPVREDYRELAGA